MTRWSLSTIARELRELPAWSQRERVTKLLVKEPEMRVLLVGLPAGARWPQHRAAARVVVAVLEGRLDFRIGDEVSTLAAGDIGTIEPSVVHDLHAHEDTFFLLTVAGPSGPVQVQ